MQQFSASFVLTMLHSTWQLAVLFLFYFIAESAVRNISPIARRNFLFHLLAVQLICSISTFYLLYTGRTMAVLSSLTFRITGLNSRWLLRVAPWLLYSYIIVVSSRAIVQAVNYRGFQNSISRSFIKPPASIKIFTSTHAQRFGIKRKIDIWLSNSANAPVLYGFLKPVILLPVTLVTQLSTAETEALIVHELSHIRHNDYLLNLFLLAMENIFFFNPFMHLISRIIKFEREKACDIQVIHFKYTAAEYATALLKIARAKNTMLSFQMAAVGSNKSALYKRIAFFSTERNFKRNAYMLLPVLFSGLLCIMALQTMIIAGSDNKPAKNLALNNARDFQRIIIPPASFPKNKLNNLNEAPAEITVAGVNKERLAEKVIASSKQPATPYTNREASAQGSQMKVIPVNYQLNSSLDSSREVIISEESSGGVSITRAYKVKLVDGKWVSEPLWLITEKSPLLNDSIKRQLTDSSIQKIQ